LKAGHFDWRPNADLQVLFCSNGSAQEGIAAMFPTIMIVDDEPSILQSLGGLLSDEGYDVITASNGYEALKKIESTAPDLVLLDVWMPGLDGIETLQEIKKISPVIQVLIITGHGNIETAVKATKLGAFDLIEKPLSFDKVIMTIQRALNFQRLEEQNRYLRRKMLEKHAINGNSAAIVALKKQIAVAAPTDAWILITGENGTGKELIARTIHQLSRRAEEPYIDINCANLSEEGFDAEFFGHEKDAFPAATGRRKGKAELAGKGTLLLDQITDLSLKNQGKLLRVLQEKQYERVGGNRTLRLDARIIATSNRDIEKEIQAGTFREELYYRLNVIPVIAPPLRDRKEDIGVLADIFLAENATQGRGSRKRLSEDALACLCAYCWPGNVRELKSLMERLSIMAEVETIRPTDLPAPYNMSPSAVSAANDLACLFAMESFDDAVEAFKETFIRKKLAQNRNDVSATAAQLHISRSVIQKLIKGQRLL
jgi:two-component system nitrogen regulation response regulator NtrX